MEIVDQILRVITYVVIADAVLSWFQPPSGFPRSLTNQLTEPIYSPIRRLLPRSGALDFSPLIVLVLVSVVRGLLRG